MKTKRIWTAVLAGICVLCFTGTALAEPAVGVALSPGASLTASPSPSAASASPSAVPSTAASASAAQPTAAVNGSVPANEHVQNFSKDHELSGLPAFATEYFNVGNWKIQKAVLNLSLNLTQIALSNNSTVSVFLNGEQCYTQKLDPQNGAKQTLAVNLPPDKVIKGSNTLVIEGYILTDQPASGGEDIDTLSGRNWMNMYKESSVQVLYTPLDTVATIADFISHFSSIDALENKNSAVAVTGNANDSEIAASMIALAGLSTNAELFYDQIAFESADSISSLKQENILFVTEYSRLPGELKSLLTPDQAAQAAKGALLVLVKKDSQNILILTGDDSAALQTAARLIGNKDNISQIKSASMPIAASYNANTADSPVSQYQNITKDGTYVNGAFGQSADFEIPYPQNRLLASGSEINLDIRYSDNLDFDRSMITVYINGRPVGSKKLTQEGANGDIVSLQIPTDLNIAGSFTLTVNFDLAIKNKWSTPLVTKTPWGYIAGTSKIKLNSVDNPYLLFDSFPAPFVTDGALQNVALVIPDSPDSADWQAMSVIFKTLGKYMTSNHGGLTVMRASKAQKLDGYNVIMVGAANRNTAIRNLNDKLLFQFTSDGSAINSNEKKTFDPTFSREFGTAQLIYSPYGTNKNAILVVSGVTDEGMTSAASYLTIKNLWQASGDGYVADSNRIYNYKFKADNQKEPAFAEAVLNRTDLQQFILIAGLFIVIVLTALVIVAVKYRKVKKNE
ncbi:MAG: cellulose biosynthesis cyclic di-GMP-binding regulatory protein BcsB [Eubacteriales bacterium]